MNKRAVNGVLLLNKEVGESSNTSLQKVKRLYAAKKAGHIGTLDPLASGMLPICLGEATKFSQYVNNADKSYRVTAKLGIKTNSGDSQGVILKEGSTNEISSSHLKEILETFRGITNQTPPMFSALKYQGQPLYQIARKGLEVPRTPRIIHIYHLELLDYQKEFFTLQVHCSKGTYIRTLIDDIGDQLGCGAHVTQLHRLRVGEFREEKMVGWEQLKKLWTDDFVSLDQQLLPMDVLVQFFPEIRLNELSARYMSQGQSVFVPNLPSEGYVRLVLPDSSFLGIGEILENGKVTPKRLVSSHV